MEATSRRPFWALSAVVAAMLAIAMFASSSPTTEAVEQASATPAAEASGSVGGNQAAAYFPGQFVNQATEVTAHIEAF